MKLKQLSMTLLALALWLARVEAQPPVKSANEMFLLIPSQGSALIVIQNANRFDPLVQRLLAEGQIKHWFVLDQPLYVIPYAQDPGYLNELQLRQLDEFFRR